MFDVAIVESGSGGEIQIDGNDLAIIYGMENQPYLASFGGNIEADTISNMVVDMSMDYWGNALLIANNPNAQFNSKLERALRSTPLTSSGRTKIINALTQDLQYIKDSLGDNVAIGVSIISDNWLQIQINITLATGTRVIIINYKKQSADGDFYQFDFNDDFY
jgi:phage gp46-like protein